MKYKSNLLILALSLVALVLGSCSHRKSYAQLLVEENISVNSFLANQRVVGYEERDSTFQFEVGPKAPYYQLDEDGTVYMQVLNPGTPDNRAKSDQLIYFRFTRYNLQDYKNGQLPEGVGNDNDVSYGDASFRYENFSSQNSYQWGSGIQMPLNYLSIDCEVNLVVKSQSGLYSEIASVIPFLYNIRYFKSQI